MHTCHKLPRFVLYLNESLLYFATRCLTPPGHTLLLTKLLIVQDETNNFLTTHMYVIHTCLSRHSNILVWLFFLNVAGLTFAYLSSFSRAWIFSALS